MSYFARKNRRGRLGDNGADFLNPKTNVKNAAVDGRESFLWSDKKIKDGYT